MKIKKFLSIVEMLTNQNLDNHTIIEDQTELQASINRLYKEITACQERLDAIGLGFDQNLPERPQKTHFVRLKVQDEKGKGTSAQVKFHPMKGGENLLGFSKISHQIEMILRQTNPDGILEVPLPLYRYSGFENGQIEVLEVTEYYVEISKGSEYGITLGRIPVGAVSSDDAGQYEFHLKKIVSLDKEGWFAGDLHHHSIYSSPVYGGTDDVIESVKDVQNAMRAMGLSFGALSDHHNILNHEAWMGTERDDFLPLVSKEISTSNGHVMSMNVYEDVIYDIPTGDDRTEEFLRNEFYRITDQIKALGGLAQINHPKEMQAAISLSEDMIQHISIFDTMEIWNGSIPMISGSTNDQAYQLWISLLQDDQFIPATAGSDTHNTRADDYHQMLNELLWFVYQFKENQMGESYPRVAHYIRSFESVLDLVEVWTKENLGTAGVRTYIHCLPPSKPTADSVLDALKKGRSIVTNGPIAIPMVHNSEAGDTVLIEKSEDTLELRCRLIFNRKLRSLEVLSKEGLIGQLDVSNLAVNQDHSVTIPIPVSGLREKDWLICRAFSDHTNLAITNPIFIRS